MTENPSTLINLEKPIEMTGKIPEDKAVFYELAQERVTFQSREESSRWRQRHGFTNETTATHAVQLCFTQEPKGNVRQFVKGLEIMVNLGYFEELSKAENKDYTNLIPYIIEHEIYEAWLYAKKGIGGKLNNQQRHLLARRREFYLAAKDGMLNHLIEFLMLTNPEKEEEYNQALEYVQRRNK